ncbi:MAG: hypothetical protein ABSC15_08620 [Terriglobales bacterium]|jgi:hypothetical protein
MAHRSHLMCNLSESMSQRLNGYALAAGAAGVGVLASATTANAKIVYTPANIPINVNGALVNLDLNHDGINDFQFAAGYSGPGVRRGGVIAPEGNHASSLGVTPEQPSNRVWAVESQGHLCAAAAPAGEPVGPHRRFQPGNSQLLMAFASGDSTHGAAFCPWIKTKQAYVGFKFLIKGKVHFGWARIKRVVGSFGFPATVTGYAYETIPNKPIVTGKTKGPDEIDVANANAVVVSPVGKPASLGLLALGAPALSAWRREESAGREITNN